MEGLERIPPKLGDTWGHIGATSGPLTTESQRTATVTTGPPPAQLTRHTPRPAQVTATRPSSLAQRSQGFKSRHLHYR
jgi:hypothetical protein